MKPSPSNPDPRLPQIEGYRLTQTIALGDRTLVYQGIRLSDGQPVVLKLLGGDSPTIHDQLRLRNHYALTKNLQVPGVIQPLDLVPYGKGLVLVTLDEGYRSLRDYLTAHPLELPEFLAIALQLADILHGLYQHRIIHKDIKPSNILFNPTTHQVKLTGFELASQLPHQTPELQSPHVLEGTLAYLSPEQTGRMNRGIDYRSDFYALGVTYYELLTGQLPFQGDDALELVYCHLAKEPIPPDELRRGDTPLPAIPKTLSKIILKLMAKNAEDRYQSASGLKADLEMV